MLTPPWLPQGKAVPKVVTRGRGRTMQTMLPAIEEPVNEADKAKMEEFARQYIIDFNQTRAAVRMGYTESYAATFGNALFWRPYTQAYLVSLIRNLEEKTIVCRNEVLAGLLREANRYGPDSSSASRVAAWKEIGKIMGMYITKVEISANSSGVMEVPIVRNPEEWEQLAHASQTILLTNARN